MWKKLWKALVDERVKNFIWRLSKDILPTKYNLRKKGIRSDVSCPFCQLYPKSSLNLFRECDFSKRVFFSLPLGVHFSDGIWVFDWIFDFLERRDSYLGQLVCTRMWKIWQARNIMVFKKECPDLKQLPRRYETL